MARTKIRGSVQLNANLLDLNDTPTTYAGSGDYLIKVNTAADAIEFADVDSIVPPSTWVSEAFVSNGTTRIYTLNKTPMTGSIIVSYSGVVLTVGAANDYTISGTTLTLDDDLVLDNGANINVFYVTQDGVTTRGLRNWFIMDSNYTAVNGDHIIFDATSGMEITLPASPSLSDEVAFLDGPGNGSTSLPVIKRNGSNIMGAANDLTIDLNNKGFRLVYSNSTWGWKLYPLL